jgi:hypothetical protein
MIKIGSRQEKTSQVKPFIGLNAAVPRGKCGRVSDKKSEPTSLLI